MAETTPQTAPEMAGAATGRSVRAALVAAAIVSTGTLLLATFELSMADWPSGVVLLGILPLTALLFFGCCFWTATLLLRVPRHGVKFAIPFLICAATLALLQYAPLHKVALQQNFQWHRADRERIVAQVESGELSPNVSYNQNLIALGDKDSGVSAGTDIVIDDTDEGTYVLFLTSRGLKHYFAGFLRVPPGGDPAKFFEFDDKPPTQVVKYADNWYFVAN